VKTGWYALLFLAGLLVSLSIAQLQPFPGYLDSDYYYAGGLQLVRGNGFSEPFVWNYLEDPPAVLHASHGYWMPLASIVAAAGMWLSGNTSYAAARLLFILIASVVPPLTAALAYNLGGRRDLALTSGLLAVFSVYHAPFLPVTDNFGISMLLGGSYLLLAGRPRPWIWLGLLSGLLTLSRSDGVLWLVLAFALVLQPDRAKRDWRSVVAMLGLVVAGFLLIMLPWYLRNLAAYGALTAPGASRVLWLQEYDQIFTYPAANLTAGSLLRSGWRAVVDARLWALGLNLQSAIAAQGAIILFPFILVGAWKHRTDSRVRLAALSWLVLLVAMTLLAPFAGARGGLFHAGSAFQPMWWALAPLGLEATVAAARRRGWFTPHAHAIFRLALVQVVVLLTGYVVWLRIFSLGWGEGEDLYPRIETYLAGRAIGPADVVIVRNPPGYYLATGRSSIMIPYGDEDTMLAVAARYGANFLVLEPQAVLGPIRDLYDDPTVHPRFEYLGEVDQVRLYEIRPQ
jgi:hypothetical protein